MFFKQWVECSLIQELVVGQCIPYAYGVMAQSFTHSTAARKGLYLRDVSLRPKTDQTRVRLHASKTTGTNNSSNLI